MALQGAEEAARSRVPQLQRRVNGPGDHRAPVRAERHRLHRARVAFQGADQRAIRLRHGGQARHQHQPLPALRLQLLQRRLHHRDQPRAKLARQLPRILRQDMRRLHQNPLHQPKHLRRRSGEIRLERARIRRPKLGLKPPEIQAQPAPLRPTPRAAQVPPKMRPRISRRQPIQIAPSIHQPSVQCRCCFAQLTSQPIQHHIMKAKALESRVKLEQREIVEAPQPIARVKLIDCPQRRRHVHRHIRILRKYAQLPIARLKPIERPQAQPQRNAHRLVAVPRVVAVHRSWAATVHRLVQPRKHARHAGTRALQLAANPVRRKLHQQRPAAQPPRQPLGIRNRPAPEQRDRLFKRQLIHPDRLEIRN